MSFAGMSEEHELSFRSLRRKRDEGADGRHADSARGESAADQHPVPRERTGGAIWGAQDPEGLRWHRPAREGTTAHRSRVWELRSCLKRVWVRRGWLLAGGAVVGFVLGLGMGLAWLPQSYVLTVRWVKQVDLGKVMAGLPESAMPVSTLGAGVLAREIPSLEGRQEAGKGRQVRCQVAAWSEGEDALRIEWRGPVSPAELVERARSTLEALEEFVRRSSADEAAEIAAFWRRRYDRVEQELKAAGSDLALLRAETQTVDAERSTQAQVVQLEELESKLAKARLEAEWRATPSPGTHAWSERLRVARRELDDLQLQYKSTHPAVEAQVARIRVLERQAMESQGAGNGTGQALAAGTEPSSAAAKGALPLEVQVLTLERSNLLARIGGVSAHAARMSELQARSRALEQARSVCREQEAEARQWAESPMALWRPLTQVSPALASPVPRRAALLICAGSVSVLCLLALVVPLSMRESRRPSIRSSHDFEAMTGVPVRAQTVALEASTPEVVRSAGERLWLQLGRGISRSGHGVSVGFMVGAVTPGVVVMVRAMAEAMRREGWKVVVVTEPGKEGGAGLRWEGSSSGFVTKGPEGAEGRSQREVGGQELLLTARQLTSAAARADRPLEIVGPGREGLLDPLQRREWVALTSGWASDSRMATVVLMGGGVEAETMLMAETVRQLFWVEDVRRPDLRWTHRVLESLERSGRHLDGAILYGKSGMESL